MNYKNNVLRIFILFIMILNSSCSTSSKPSIVGEPIIYPPTYSEETQTIQFLIQVDNYSHLPDAPIIIVNMGFKPAEYGRSSFVLIGDENNIMPLDEQSQMYQRYHFLLQTATVNRMRSIGNGNYEAKLTLVDNNRTLYSILGASFELFIVLEDQNHKVFDKWDGSVEFQKAINDTEVVNDIETPESDPDIEENQEEASDLCGWTDMIIGSWAYRHSDRIDYLNYEPDGTGIFYSIGLNGTKFNDSEFRWKCNNEGNLENLTSGSVGPVNVNQEFLIINSDTWERAIPPIEPQKQPEIQTPAFTPPSNSDIIVIPNDYYRIMTTLVRWNTVGEGERTCKITSTHKFARMISDEIAEINLSTTVYSGTLDCSAYDYPDTYYQINIRTGQIVKTAEHLDVNVYRGRNIPATNIEIFNVDGWDYQVDRTHESYEDGNWSCAKNSLNDLITGIQIYHDQLCVHLPFTDDSENYEYKVISMSTNAPIGGVVGKFDFSYDWEN